MTIYVHFPEVTSSFGYFQFHVRRKSTQFHTSLNPHQQLGGFFVLVSVATPSVQTVANQFKMWECLCCYRARSLTIDFNRLVKD